MSPTVGASKTLCAGFPRMSGDEPAVPKRIIMGAKFSPHERG